MLLLLLVVSLCSSTSQALVHKSQLDMATVSKLTVENDKQDRLFQPRCIAHFGSLPIV